VENGARALERVKAEEYLVVLMDCQMPVMDGYEATREIRKFEESTGRRTTVIALTAHALTGEREKVLAAGMDDYLAKPVRPSSLDKMIRRHARARLKSAPMKAERVIPDVEPELSILDATISRSRKLIEIFLKNMPTQLSAIQAAYAAAMVTEVRNGAHKAKGSCLALGATGMATCAERLQKLAETGSLEGAEGAIAELSSLYAKVEVELRRELEALSQPTG
jgi:CheY-like chemotaxis protein/HPt (histidine-containing phosphotransfer) domain-containing protein